nr:hypothetical protein Itr_chr02CG15660 [Ipomoea trifida]GLL25777.1 hypothetical protein Itr_chr04CG24000 [Ipomoea trifida]
MYKYFIHVFSKLDKHCPNMDLYTWRYQLCATLLVSWTMYGFTSYPGAINSVLLIWCIVNAYYMILLLFFTPERAKTFVALNYRFYM